MLPDMLPDCVFLPDFDMLEFITAGLALSIVSYVWQDSSAIIVDTRNPVSQTEQGWKAISALHRWADRTDPGSCKRNAYYQRAWNEREPGQEIVVLDLVHKETSRTPLLLSL